MGTPLIGFGGILGLAEQSDFATPVANSTHWLPILSHSVGTAPQVVPVPFLGVANAQDYHATRDTDVLSVDVGGDIDTIAMYDSKAFALLLKHAMGSVASVIVSAGPKYTHTFSLDTDAVQNGFTGQSVFGQGISDRAEVFCGLRISQLVLSVDARGWMRATASVIGRSSGGATTVTGTPLHPVCERVRASVGSVFNWNSHNVNMRTFRLTINNNLQRRPTIGTPYTDIPVPGGFASIGIDATFSWEDNSIYTDYISGVTANANVAFQGLGDNDMTLNCNNLRVTSMTRSVQGPGELVYSVRAMCSANPGTSQALGVVIHNDNTTAI